MKRIALCVRKTDDQHDLVLGKTYTVLDDKKADERGFIRVVDESEEDYLYEKSQFHVGEIPR